MEVEQGGVMRIAMADALKKTAVQAFVRPVVHGARLIVVACRDLLCRFVTGDGAFFLKPCTQVDQLAAFAAKWLPMRAAVPCDRALAIRTAYLDFPGAGHSAHAEHKRHVFGYLRRPFVHSLPTQEADREAVLIAADLREQPGIARQRDAQQFLVAAAWQSVLEQPASCNFLLMLRAGPG